MGVRIIRRQSDGLAQSDDRFVQSSLLFKRNAQIISRFGKARIKLNRAIKRSDRLIQFPFFKESSAQIVVSLGVIWLQFYRLGECANRFVEPFQTLEGNPQIVIRFGRMGFDLDQPVDQR